MKIGITLPQFRHEAGSAIEAARRAEDLGLDGVFCFDHLWPMAQPDRPALSMAPLLGALAASTSTISVGTLVSRVGLVPDGVLVAADRHRLEQVLLNLALNAFRFMPDGGLLRIRGEVSSRAGKATAAVEISDTGPGIAAEDRERIFHPGFTTCAGSPGLGLAVCKTIMEQHGGGITVDSGSGHGTTFKLEFPLSGANE